MINKCEFIFLYMVYMCNCYQLVYVFEQYVQTVRVKVVFCYC